MTLVAPSGRCSYWSTQNHRSFDKIQLRYLFIPPPVAWFHLWVDTLLTFIEFLSWSIRHMVSECGLLHDKINSFNQRAVKETYVIIVAKVVWIGKTILTHLARFPIVDTHWVRHFVLWFEEIVRGRKVADNCHHRVVSATVTVWDRFYYSGSKKTYNRLVQSRFLPNGSLD